MAQLSNLEESNNEPFIWYVGGHHNIKLQRFWIQGRIEIGDDGVTTVTDSTGTIRVLTEKAGKGPIPSASGNTSPSRSHASSNLAFSLNMRP